VLIVEENVDLEQVYWERLLELGLIKEICFPPTREELYEPVPVTGKPVSETIIEGRR
jgi:hypothetical protein